MSPEEAEKNSYLIIDVYFIGRFMFYSSLSLTILAVYLAAHPNYIDDNYFSNATKTAILEHKIFENGTRYMEHRNEAGEVVAYSYLYEWFGRLLDGWYRYSFGNSFHNYCTDRIVPKDEWMKSIYRSMNLFVYVQVLFRSAVLLTMTNSLFQCLLLKHKALSENHKACKYLGTPAMIIELFHYVSLFLISCLHTEQDTHLMPFTRLSIICIGGTTVFRLLYIAKFQSNRIIQTFCIFLSAVVFLLHNNILSDFDSFIDTAYCDATAPSIVVISQLIFLFSFMVVGYLQNETLKGFRTLICTLEYEVEMRNCIGQAKI